MNQKISALDVANLRKISGAGLMECKKALVKAAGNIDKAKEILKNKGLAVALKKSTRQADDGALFVKVNEEHNKLAFLRLASETDFVARNEKFQELGSKLTFDLYNTGVDAFAKSLEEGEVKSKIIDAIQLLGENIVALEYDVISTSNQNYVDYYLHTNKKLLAVLEISCDAKLPWDKLSEVSKKLCMHLAANRTEALREDDIDEDIIKAETKMYESIEEKSSKPLQIKQKIIAGKLAKFKREIVMLSQPFLIDPELTVATWLKQQEEKLAAKIEPVSFRKIVF